jgi:hypothetical protein
MNSRIHLGLSRMNTHIHHGRPAADIEYAFRPDRQAQIFAPQNWEFVLERFQPAGGALHTASFRPKITAPVQPISADASQANAGIADPGSGRPVVSTATKQQYGEAVPTARPPRPDSMAVRAR